MPTGSISYQYPGGGLGLQAAQVATFVYDGANYTWLPNVQCMQVQWSEGKTPRSAQFRYLLDSSGLTGFPSQFEDLWPLMIAGGSQSYGVTSSTRLIVIVQTPDGTPWLIFDGFPRLPQTDYGDNEQQVTFLAIGVETRASDIPIAGRYQRDVGLAIVPDNENPATGLPTKFNPTDSVHPYGLPNCTGDDLDHDEEDPSTSYPVFIDELTIARPGAMVSYQSYWTLGKAVRYILGVYNAPTTPTGATRRKPFVANPDFTQLNVLLDNYAPLPGQKFFDPLDPDTFVTNPIILRELDITNMPWPDALEQLLGFYNFGFCWDLTADSNLNPTTTLRIYRKDPGNTTQPKDLFLQEAGDPLDLSQTNVASFSASFDYYGIANAFRVETHPVLWEVSFILSPAFTPQSGDYMAPTYKQFLKNNLNGATQAVRDKYRLYTLDENGIGYWDFTQSKFITGVPTDLSAIFPPDNNGRPTYAARARQCKDRLITTDQYGEKYRSQLAFSRNMNADGSLFNPLFNFPTVVPDDDFAPTVGTIAWSNLPWREIPQGQWDFEDDRIGIRFTCENPDEIHVGKAPPGMANPQEPSEVLKGIKSISDPYPNGTLVNPGPGSPQLFFLRLTTVIEADRGLDVIAGSRQASPLANVVLRRLDAKDVFQKQVILSTSAFYGQANNNLNPVGNPNDFDAPYLDENNNIVARDDTNAAQAYADQMRTSHEMPSMPMAVSIPYFTTSYVVGDRVDQIQGRNVSLQTNAANEQGEAPAFPFVISVVWRFEGDNQSTSMSLSDHRLVPQSLWYGDRRHSLRK